MEDIKRATKFPNLKNEEWLKQKYVNEKLTTSEMGLLLGCSRDSIRKALIAHNITLRKAGESNAAKSKRLGFQSKYSNLNDKNWLYQKYVVENKSLEEIGYIVKAKNHNSVRQALFHYKIKIRNISEGLILNRVEDGFQIDEGVINGSLLGDAGLRCHNKSNIYSLPSFYKKNINYDHVLFVAKCIFEFNPESRIKIEYSFLHDKKFSTFLVRSLVHKELIPFWLKWYPEKNNFVKVVPRDLKIDEKVLLHWFMDDGSTSFRNRTNRSEVRFTFCSESFVLEDQQFLCDQINSKYSLKAKTTPTSSGTGYRINIPQSKVNDFFDIIGPCPQEIPSMTYKWKLNGLPLN